MDPGEFVTARPLPLLKKYACHYRTCPQISHWNYQLPLLNKLNLEYFDVEEGADVVNIFKTVNSCGSTLRRLRLYFDFKRPLPMDASSWQDRLPEGLQLELLHLEILDLFVINTKITNIDYLLPLVSLKKMSFSYDAMRGDDSVENGNGIIQFAGYRDRLHESNLWNLLSQLRQVKVKTVPIVDAWTRMMNLMLQIGEPEKKITVYTRDYGYRTRQSILN